MFKLSMIKPEDIDGGINLIDLGASGEVPNYWKPLAHLTNLIGFDPNEKECARLTGTDSGFLSQTFLPYAIAGENKTFTLYKTNSIYCWSLLQPNLPWLRRFAYSDLFEVRETEEIPALTLESVKGLGGLPSVDAIKLDTQGLELPILKASQKIVQQCILIETETGFTDNYIGESTFDQVAAYMRSLGFGLFDITPYHRISRKNALSSSASNEELLWCEAVWLRDYCKTSLQEAAGMTREKALKALCIYANHGCYAFGLEAAKRFHELGLLSAQEYGDLANGTLSWIMPKKENISLKRRLIRSMINLIPRRYYDAISEDFQKLRNIRHPLSYRSAKKA